MSCCNKEKLNINNCNVRIASLPNWCITDLNPAFYDTESRTAIEQTARLYAKMQELICDYNDYVNKLNNYIKDFEDGLINDFEEFKENINNIVNEFENLVNGKMQEQDDKLEDAINYMKNNLTETATNLLNEMIESGTLNVLLTYTEETESLNLVVSNNEESEVNNNE